ncbi:DUF6233 domain-containing protein [Streptomyces niveus]
MVPSPKLPAGHREQAIEALAQGGREPCKMCRPDTALGLL